MDTKTDIEIVFSAQDGVLRAREIARTTVPVYYENYYQGLPFDDMIPENADGWIHYPGRYVRYENVSSFISLWREYQDRNHFLKRSGEVEFPAREEAKETIRHIQLKEKRFLLRDTDIVQNRLIEHRYYEDFFSTLCFILAVLCPDVSFEGMCQTVEESYAKRIRTHAVYDGRVLTFEQMEGDPVYGTIIVTWTRRDDKFVKSSRRFSYIRVEITTQDPDGLNLDEELSRWIGSVNDMKMEMISAQLCFRHASPPCVMLYAPSGDVCGKYCDELLSLLKEKGLKAEVFSGPEEEAPGR